MSQLFENFNSVAISYTNVSTLTFRAAESFTPQQKHLINSVKLKVYRTTNAPTGVMTVEIRTDNAGVPSATVLASGTSDPVTWDAITWHWREITLNAQPMLSAGVKYWIVISCAGVDASHYIRWQRDSEGTYVGGNMATSTNSGNSWTAYTVNDYMFEEYGILILERGNAMSDKLYKVNEVIGLGYQAPNAESGLVNVVAEIYLPNKAKDSNYPDVLLVEVETTGTYYGEFTPDEQGIWQVLMHKADGDGQVTKSYSVGAHNVHSVGEDVATVDGKVVAVEGKVDTVTTNVATVDGKVVTVDGKVDTVNTNMAKDATVAKADALATAAGKVDTVDGKVVTLDGKVVTVDGKVDACKAAIDAMDIKVSSLDTPPMAF